MLLDYHVGLELGYFDGLEDLYDGLGHSLLEDEYVKARRIVRRVARFDPDLAGRASELLGVFSTSVERFDEPLPRVDDENLEVDLEPGMAIYQAARWVAGADGALEAWQVNDRLWSRMDPRQRAGLILHEVFYVLHNERRHAGLATRRQNARYLRQFIASISCDFFTQWERGDWDAMTTALRLF
jgi:hypothetical protein